MFCPTQFRDRPPRATYERGTFRGVEHEKEQSLFRARVPIDSRIGCADRGGRVRGPDQPQKYRSHDRGAGHCPARFERDQDRGSVGKSGGVAVGQVSRPERAWTLLNHSHHRHGPGLGRHSRDHRHLQSGKDVRGKGCLPGTEPDRGRFRYVRQPNHP